MLKMSNKNYYKFAKCSTLWPFCSDIVQKLWGLFCLLPPCSSTGAKMFWAGPKFCAQPKIYLWIVLVQNLCQTKRWFTLFKIISWKVLDRLLNINQFLVQHKEFGSAQNSLGPVKEQGIYLWNWFQMHQPIFDPLLFAYLMMYQYRIAKPDMIIFGRNWPIMAIV